MTPEQKRLSERIQASASAPVWVDETVWNGAAPYKVPRPKPEWGTPMKINIESSSFTNPKVTSLVMSNPPAKLYRASIMIETNDLDRGTVTVQRLLSVDIAFDDFDELVKAAHGHLDLVKDS